MKHIGRFMTQSVEASQNEFHKLQLFPLSLKGVAFTWYSNLSPNVVQNWVDMERCFHDRFYRPQPKVIIANLMNMKQMVDKSTIDFIEGFRKAGSHCSVQFLEVECTTMVGENMHPQLMRNWQLKHKVTLANQILKIIG